MNEKINVECYECGFETRVYSHYWTEVIERDYDRTCPICLEEYALMRKEQ